MLLLLVLRLHKVSLNHALLRMGRVFFLPRRRRLTLYLSTFSHLLHDLSFASLLTLELLSQTVVDLHLTTGIQMSNLGFASDGKQPVNSILVSVHRIYLGNAVFLSGAMRTSLRVKGITSGRWVCILLRSTLLGE